MLYDIEIFVDASPPHSIFRHIKNHNIVSPVVNLEASVAAASSRATVVAVLASSHDKNNFTEEQECVVLLTHTPPSPSTNLTRFKHNVMSCYRLDNNDKWERLTAYQDGNDGLATDEVKDEDLISILSRGPIKHAHSHSITTLMYILRQSTHPLVLAATGFASDVSHLSLHAAAAVVEDETNNDRPRLDAHALTKNVLAKRTSLAAGVGGGSRPFGVEMLVVGTDRHGQRKRTMTKNGTRELSSFRLSMYTIDASGNWRHWGGWGTCVGRMAGKIRRELHHLITCKRHDKNTLGVVQKINTIHDDVDVSATTVTCPIKTWKQALNTAMAALLKVSMVDMMNNCHRDDIFKRMNDETQPKDVTDQYDAIVIFADQHMARISRPMLEVSYHQCMRDVVESVA